MLKKITRNKKFKNQTILINTKKNTNTIKVSSKIRNLNFNMSVFDT